MAILAETFRDPNSRKTKTIVAVDLTNSTSMKEQQPEATWLTTYGWFFDMLRDSVAQFNGKIVKYLGDGCMAIFGEDNAADAINWGVTVQEKIAEAQAEGRVSCECSIGVAYGEVVEFDTPEGHKDYIGTIVDKAFRLCSAANSRAVFVDGTTISAASMTRVKSKQGVASTPKRPVAEYQGREETVKAKGFLNPIPYYEILWGSTRYGVRGEFVTGLSSEKPHEPKQPPVPEARPPAAADWLRGKVVTQTDSFGFINSGDEDFWFNNSFLFRRSLPVNVDDVVWFKPADPFRDAKNRRATDVVALGAELDGELEKAYPEKGFGFVLCTDDRGVLSQIYVSPIREDDTPRSRIRFVVSENRRGMAGVVKRVAP